MSALGEPLKAEVELVAEKNESNSLSVRLASPDAFERSGLAYSNLLTGVKVSIEKRASGEPYVKITSAQPATEPFVDLLIELTWSSGRISREFTALLDPPDVLAERSKQKAAAAEVKPAQPPATAPVAEPVPAPEAIQPEQAPKAEAPAAAPSEPAPQASTETRPEEAKPEEPKPEAAPAAEARPEEAAKPTETIGGAQPTLLEGGQDSSAKADAYGPVKSGDTLNKIATATKPADVSLEQMLVLLVRNNPEAFSGKNMNRLKTGKILQLPTSEQLSSVSEADARKEVKIQARDWRAYREQLAAAAGQAAPAEQPAQQAASGKVGAPAQDKAATEQPKEVLKLSKNEPAAAAGAGNAQSAARVRALEEEVVARDKAIKEANDRVAMLQKQIEKLNELRKLQSNTMAEAPKPAAPPPAVTTPAPATQTAPKPEPPATPAAPKTPAPVVPAPEAKPATPTPATPAPVAPKSDTAPAPNQPAPTTPKPVAPKAAPPAPPAPEPSLMDQVLDQPAYLGAAIGVLVIIGALAVRAVKRRRESKSDAEESAPARAAGDNNVLAVASPAAAIASTASEGASDEVDPIAEAEIFLAYGRDAQAEELLKEALETSPKRAEIQLKLLQIYASRKDAKSFEKVARDLQQGTGGKGEIWDQAVVLGYQVDPENSRYAAGKGAAAAGIAAAATAAAAAENVDFNIGSEDSTATTTDIDLGDGGSPFDRTGIIDPAAEPDHDSTVSLEAPPAPAAMDFNVDLPAVGGTASEPQAAKADSASGLDFDIDLNSLAASAPESSVAAAEPSASAGGLDFDMSGLSLDTPAEPKVEARAAAPEIDLSGISLDLGMETSPAISPTGKDDHWYDVQTKFDLAKAYQEMGDKDGAREILKEVLQEGDTEQKAAAQTVLTSLDA
ncbi:MAG TPA: FimV/HubP family polar landmark protein [Burkholderiales bacterium]|nr:FimV/HubP family polar landmark protein [Burkholderiales bacterium]